MTIEITDLGNAVKVTYKDGNGNQASATVVGESASLVKERADEIVNNHNLEEKAQ